MAMGRSRKHRKDLPNRVYERRGAFYFVDRPGRWHPLGRDYHEAMVRYAEINQAKAPATTMGHVMDRYLREILPTKAPSTAKGQARELGTLRKVFGHMRPDEITPRHVYAYLDHRAAVKGNREKSLLSHVFTYAIRWGSASANPCRLVKRNPEKPRTRYVTDEEFEVGRGVMPEAIQCAMDLAYATGLRQGDILGLKRSDWSDDGGLSVCTGKTKRRMIFAPTPELKEIIERCKALPSKVSTLWLIHTRAGQPYTGSGFRAIWQRRIRKAHEDGVISERFTFHDLRAKTGSETTDDQHLGHQNPATMNRHYKRAPVRVTPLVRKNIGQK